MNYTNGNQRQPNEPNENKGNNDNPRTKTMDEHKDGQIWILVVDNLQEVDIWHF